MGLNVNYFANLGAEYHFSKLGFSKFNFPKRRGCQCNLPYIFFYPKLNVRQIRNNDKIIKLIQMEYNVNDVFFSNMRVL